MSTRDQNRKKLREFAHYCITRIMHVVLIREITAEDSGMIRIGEEKLSGCNPRKTDSHNSMPCMETKVDKRGSKKVDRKQGYSSHSKQYPPRNNIPATMGSGTRWARGIPRELEEQGVRSTSKEWLLIGGDHNSHMVRREEEAFNRGVCGRHVEDPEASASKNSGGHLPLWVTWGLGGKLRIHQSKRRQTGCIVTSGAAKRNLLWEKRKKNMLTCLVSGKNYKLRHYRRKSNAEVSQGSGIC